MRPSENSGHSEGDVPAKVKLGRGRSAPRRRRQRTASPLRSSRKIFKLLGPGLITGAADDDPSGIATYSSVGAQFGYAMLWTMPFIYPFMAAI